MSILKTIDSKLMSLLTYNLRYPDWSKAPLSFALVVFLVFTFLGMAFTVLQIARSGFDWTITLLSGFFLLLGFYHWRLWRRLKRERALFR